MDRFDRIVASLQEAAVDDTRWRETSVLIEEACGISGADLLVASGRCHEEAVPALGAAFRRGGGLENPRPRRTHTDPHELGRVVACEPRPNGVLHSPTRGPNGPESDQINMIGRLSPYVRQFIRVRSALAAARALNESFLEVLGHGLAGVLCVDRCGRVVRANSVARTLLRRRDGVLQDRDGSLRARLPDEDTRLRGLLAGASTPSTAPGVAGSMAVQRPPNLTPLTLRVTPVVSRGVGRESSHVASLVLIVDPAEKPRMDPEHVAAALGLTPAESGVAVAVAEGATAREIAAATSRREATVRELLKRVHVKLGISRRADLVRAVLLVGAFTGRLR